MSEVLAVNDWPTNAALIADVAKLYLKPDDWVLDVTYGRGRWWTEYRPKHLVTNDLYSDEAMYHDDFREVYHRWAPEAFDVIAFDPPYKLNGTPALGDFDDAYGIAQPTSWRERMDLIEEGLVSCLALEPRVLLAKCQDQVVSGKMRWQTHVLTEAAARSDVRLVDRFDMIGGTRPQPKGRRQVHARGRGSTLLVFGEAA